MILERETELAELAGLVGETTTAGGRVVLVRGEAGIGKSTLVNRFLSDWHDRAHTLLGFCDDLLTPQPLGPIWDIARIESSLAQPLLDSDRRAVMEGLLDLLSRTLRPTVVVLEDMQWADEATLDLIKFLGRRIARTNGLLVLTYRDVEVDADHPLRRVIGELPPQNLVRISLNRLSAEAVTSMIESERFDVDAVLALTGGNPLFVTEVLASGTDAVPLSVREAVLARTAKVSPQARRVLELVSVVPGDVERRLVDEIAHPATETLAECVRQGLLKVESEVLSFTHDLQRRAVESSLSSVDRKNLNQQVLNALADSVDPARRVHHAKEAGDVDAILACAPRAAREAMAMASTAQAVSHFRALEPHLGTLDIEQRADILADWAREESYLDNPGSIDLFDRAIEEYRLLGDDIKLARTLTMASGFNRARGRHAHSEAFSIEAVALLEQYGPSVDLARSLSQRAFTEFVYRDRDSGVLPLVNRAMSMASEIADDEAMMWALDVKGHLTFSRGDRNGLSLMMESLRLAQRASDQWAEVRALINITGMYADVREMAQASDFAQRARDTAARYEIISLELRARAMNAELQLWKGDWASAEDDATEVLGSNPNVEILAWRVLANIQSRRGRNEARAAVYHMWSLIAPDIGPTVTDPAAAALAEYVWLSNERDPEILGRLEEVLAEGIAIGTPWPSGALAFWMWKLGLLDNAPAGTADFYGWIINGEYQKSADFWHNRGIPYEEGLALMHGAETQQIEAIRIFEDLGATAVANKARRSLLNQGVRVPRGMSQTTRTHAAGLTARQAEVLEFLAGGRSNLDIADELFVSQRTVESHVSAILMKLDVASREAAVEVARKQGILTDC